MLNLPECIWKITGALATFAIDNLRRYDQSEALWMCTKSKSPFFISFFAILQRLNFRLTPLDENVLQDDALHPSGGLAARR